MAHPDEIRSSVPATTTAAVTISGFPVGRLTLGGSRDLVRVAVLRPYGSSVFDAAAIVILEWALDLFVLLTLGATALTVGFLGGMLAALAMTGIGTMIAGLVLGRRSVVGSRILSGLPERLNLSGLAPQTRTRR
jgi:hypothetical protein